MAVTLVSQLVGSDPAAGISDFYKFMARDPAMTGQITGKGNIRCKVTTTDATPGIFLILTNTTLNASEGPLTFDPGVARVIKVKAVGKTAAGVTNLEYFENSLLVIGAATPTIVNGTPTFVADNNTVAGAVTGTAGVGIVNLLLTGKAAAAITWYIDITVDDAIAVD